MTTWQHTLLVLVYVVIAIIALIGLTGCANSIWGIYEPESWAYHCAVNEGLTPGDAKHTACMNHYYGQWARAEMSRPAFDGYRLPPYPPPWAYETGLYPRTRLTVCDQVGRQVVCY